MVLPPIIFSAGYNLKNFHLFENIKFISIYGLFGWILIKGTIITYIIILGLTILINEYNQIIIFRDFYF